MPKIRSLLSQESSPSIKGDSPTKLNDVKAGGLEPLEELPEHNSIEEEAEDIDDEDEEDQFSFNSEQARIDMEKMKELEILGENLKNGLDQKVSTVQGAHINPPQAA